MLGEAVLLVYQVEVLLACKVGSLQHLLEEVVLLVYQVGVLLVCMAGEFQLPVLGEVLLLG